jgi:hypothetical protein
MFQTLPLALKNGNGSLSEIKDNLLILRAILSKYFLRMTNEVFSLVRIPFAFQGEELLDIL